MIRSLLFIALILVRSANANPILAGSASSCPDAYDVASGTARGSATNPKTPGHDERVRAIRAEQQRWKDKGVKEEHLPFVLDHGYKTKGSIVLIHGISETPAGIKFLAEEYYKQGFNVVTVLLEGHGTSPEALNNGNLAAWRDQIDHAVKQAGPLGDKVMVGGYSFGATLALDAGSRLKDQVGGIALHSPMLVADKDVSAKVRARPTNEKVPVEKRIWTSDKADESKPGIDGFTYQRTPTQAYINMLDEVEGLRPMWKEKIEVPIYVTYGEADRIANPNGTKGFINTQGVAPGHVLYVEGAQHDDTVRVTKRRRYPTEQMASWIAQMLE